MNIGIEAAARFELLALISRCKIFSDRGGNANLFGKLWIVGNRLHQTVLGW
jgi:hypothetical protein